MMRKGQFDQGAVSHISWTQNIKRKIDFATGHDGLLSCRLSHSNFAILITAFDNNDDLPDKEKPKSFFMRMKCTLVRRGGSYTKSSGFKVGIFS